MINDTHTSITFPVVEIDAWAGDEEGSWDWNSWAYVGHLELNLDSPHQEIINLFIQEDFSDTIVPIRLKLKMINSI
jgi:hypothetical protein